MTTPHKLALIGFGTVGQGLAEILLAKGAELAARDGVQFQVVAISDLLKGSLYNRAGLDLAVLLELVRRTGKLEDYASLRPSPALFSGWDSLRTIRESNADTVVEISWTDVQTGQPAIDHVKAAFESGKNAVLTNKGPVALAYRDLAGLAAVHDVQFRFEGTVMSGTPTIRLAQSSLAGCEILEIQGILNGTTNYILTQMESGQSYADALAEAQRLGYAEADPTADVEGWDAAGKAVILANVLMGGELRVADVDRTGISGLTLADVEAAKAAGQRWKLIARVWAEAGGDASQIVATNARAEAGGDASQIVATNARSEAGGDASQIVATNARAEAGGDASQITPGGIVPGGIVPGRIVRASVRPTRLPLSHPLAGVSGAVNACTYTTDLLGDVTLVGPGAGRMETGYAVLGDLLEIVRNT
jgi:homoserine dehydrogenase